MSVKGEDLPRDFLSSSSSRRLVMRGRLPTIIAVVLESSSLSSSGRMAATTGEPMRKELL